ncbi:MAG: hypothetical protein LBS69_06555, partial [Prevotellaceae bacterium]|nr:hypothetical protein [Prevotellaceae bacterium]
MKKLITLTPVGSYYFGGEHSFTVGKKEDDNNDLASYIVESNLFPQQTSLLGMLRFWILRNDELAFNLATNRIANEQRANELIGKSSFCANEERNFGKIKGLGVCFLQKNGKAVLPTPLDYGLNVDFSKSQT